jgi:hypothetical protein
MYFELYGDGNMVRYTRFKGFRDKSNNKKIEGKTKSNACAKDTVSEYEIFFLANINPQVLM